MIRLFAELFGHYPFGICSIGVAVTVVVAISMTYRFVESPGMRWGRRWTARVESERPGNL